MIHVQHRAHKQDADFAGRTVAEARTAFENTFGIPADATPMINGTASNEHTILQDTDKLEFVSSAMKGTTKPVTPSQDETA